MQPLKASSKCDSDSLTSKKSRRIRNASKGFKLWIHDFGLVLRSNYGFRMLSKRIPRNDQRLATRKPEKEIEPSLPHIMDWNQEHIFTRYPPGNFQPIGHQERVKAQLVCQPIIDDDEVPKLVAGETFKAATDNGYKS
nr:hypothetical protein [Tanacetum cinerariifolium]